MAGKQAHNLRNTLEKLPETMTWHYVVLGLVFCVGFLLRWQGWAQASVREIEELTQLAFRHSQWLAMVRMSDPVHVYGLLPTTVSYVFHQRYEGATLALRQFSLVAGMLTLPMMYVFVKSLFGKSTALHAVALLAVLPWTVEISRWASPYALFVLLTLMAVAIWIKIMKELEQRSGPDPLRWAQCLMVLLLWSYTHHLGLLASFVISLATIGFAWGHRSHAAASMILFFLLLSANLPQLLFLEMRPQALTPEMIRMTESAVQNHYHLIYSIPLLGVLWGGITAFRNAAFATADPKYKEVLRIWMMVPVTLVFVILAQKSWGGITTLDGLLVMMPVLIVAASWAINEMWQKSTLALLYGVMLYGSLGYVSWVMVR